MDDDMRENVVAMRRKRFNADVWENAKLTTTDAVFLLLYAPTQQKKLFRNSRNTQTKPIMILHCTNTNDGSGNVLGSRARRCHEDRRTRCFCFALGFGAQIEVVVNVVEAMMIVWLSENAMQIRDEEGSRGCISRAIIN